MEQPNPVQTQIMTSLAPMRFDPAKINPRLCVQLLANVATLFSFERVISTDVAISWLPGRESVRQYGHSTTLWQSDASMKANLRRFHVKSDVNSHMICPKSSSEAVSLEEIEKLLGLTALEIPSTRSTYQDLCFKGVQESYLRKGSYKVSAMGQMGDFCTHQMLIDMAEEGLIRTKGKYNCLTKWATSNEFRIPVVTVDVPFPPSVLSVRTKQPVWSIPHRTGSGRVTLMSTRTRVHLVYAPPAGILHVLMSANKLSYLTGTAREKKILHRIDPRIIHHGRVEVRAVGGNLDTPSTSNTGSGRGQVLAKLLQGLRHTDDCGGAEKYAIIISAIIALLADLVIAAPSDEAASDSTESASKRTTPDIIQRLREATNEMVDSVTFNSIIEQTLSITQKISLQLAECIKEGIPKTEKPESAEQPSEIQNAVQARQQPRPTPTSVRRIVRGRKLMPAAVTGAIEERGEQVEVQAPSAFNPGNTIANPTRPQSPARTVGKDPKTNSQTAQPADISHSETSAPRIVQNVVSMKRALRRQESLAKAARRRKEEEQTSIAKPDEARPAPLPAPAHSLKTTSVAAPINPEPATLRPAPGTAADAPADRAREIRESKNSVTGGMTQAAEKTASDSALPAHKHTPKPVRASVPRRTLVTTHDGLRTKGAQTTRKPPVSETAYDYKALLNKLVTHTERVQSETGAGEADVSWIDSQVVEPAISAFAKMPIKQAARTESSVSAAGGTTLPGAKYCARHKCAEEPKTSSKAYSTVYVDIAEFTNEQVRAAFGMKLRDPTLENYLIVNDRALSDARNVEFGQDKANEKRRIDNKVLETLCGLCPVKMVFAMAWITASKLLCRLTQNVGKSFTLTEISGDIRSIPDSMDEETFISRLTDLAYKSRHVVTYSQIEILGNLIWASSEATRDGTNVRLPAPGVLEIIQTLRDLTAYPCQSNYIFTRIKVWITRRLTFRVSEFTPTGRLIQSEDVVACSNSTRAGSERLVRLLRSGLRVGIVAHVRPYVFRGSNAFYVSSRGELKQPFNEHQWGGGAVLYKYGRDNQRKKIVQRPTHYHNKFEIHNEYGGPALEGLSGQYEEYSQDYFDEYEVSDGA